MKIPPPSSTFPTPTSTTGFSLSPGGLLLPYHVGALEALEYHGYLSDHTPLAGSSAGSIAAAAQACGIDGPSVLEATIQISDYCDSMGGARGRLLGALRTSLGAMITEEEHRTILERPGKVVIAYQEIFPRYRSIHETKFETRDDLIDAICHSSTFPFFTTHWPAGLAATTTTRSSRSGKRDKFLPRLVMDGYFAVPRDRFGCPDFDLVATNNDDDVVVDRTVMISVLPQTLVGLNACDSDMCISPPVEDSQNQLQQLLRLAKEPSSRQELTQVYENGWHDAERWCREHGHKISSSTITTTITNCVVEDNVENWN